MDKKPSIATPPGITIREMKSGPRIQIFFTYQSQQCRELLPPSPINKSTLQYAANLRGEIQRKISDGDFKYADYFPDSPKAKLEDDSKISMETMLQKQLELYEKQVANGKMSPSTFRGYAKSIAGERMKHWHRWKLTDVTPAAIREWVGEMDCTSKAIRNLLIPLRSIMEDALNSDLITSNPFDRIALAKLIRQTSKASDYVINPFSAAERQAILDASRGDERAMYQFWFNAGLRPGELQALEWKHVNWEEATIRIEQNQVAGVIKTPKTMAGIRVVDLNEEAMDALRTQKANYGHLSDRIWLNPSTLSPWKTDAQIRKNSWLPLMARSKIPYRNPYQIRHTFASTKLTAGANPWYMADQLGHEDVQLVFKTYGKFIRADFHKPKAMRPAEN